MASQGHGGGGEADDSIQTGSSVAAVALLLLRALWIAGQEVADPEIWATGRTEAGGKRTEARGSCTTNPIEALSGVTVGQ